MMNLLKNLASKTFGDYNSTPESIFCCYTNNDPRWTSGDYESVCEEGFLRNVIAFRAINLISRGIASIPLGSRRRLSSSFLSRFMIRHVYTIPQSKKAGAPYFSTLSCHPYLLRCSSTSLRSLPISCVLLR